MALWSRYGHERPDYKTYVKRIKDREKADKKAQKKIDKDTIKIEKLNVQKN